MTIPEYVDEYTEMKWPGLSEKFGRISIEKLKEVYQAKDYDELEDRLRLGYEIRSKQMNKALEAADHKVLDLLGTDLAEVQAMKAERKRKKAGGKAPNHAAKNRLIAFVSFLESEKAGKNFAGAISEAVKVVNGSPTEKTLRVWLNNLIKFGVCTIPPPTRSKKLRK